MDYQDYTFTILGHLYEAGSVAWGVQDIAVDELTGSASTTPCSSGTIGSRIGSA